MASIAWIWYLALIPAERVPRRPVTHAAVMVAAIVVAILGVGEGLVPLAFSVSAVVLAGYFLYLLTVAELPPGQLVVSVGDSLPAFSSISDDGSPFDSDAWSGRRIMLKFFRGGW